MTRGLCFAVCSLAALTTGLSGCSRDATQKTSDLNVRLDKIDTVLLSTQTAPEKTYYSLRGKAIPAFVDAVRAESESVPSDTGYLQVYGRDVDAYAFDRHGAIRYRIFMIFQEVKGIGGKNDPDWDKGLLNGQGESCSSLMGLLEKVGEPISPEEFDRRVRTAAPADHVSRRWKN